MCQFTKTIRMNCYNFVFQKSYTGFWEIEGMDKSIAGTLSLLDNSIEIDLYCEGSLDIRIDGVKMIRGKAFENNQKNEHLYCFILTGFHLKKATRFFHGMYHTVLDVESFYIYQEGVNTNEILSACIRTQILDNWASTLIKRGYKDSGEKHQVKLEYVSPDKLTLYKDPETELCIYIYFGLQQAYSGNDVSIRPRCFLNIDFGKTINIHEAFKLIETTKFFFFLIWNNTFQPTFTEFRTSKGNFILKLSNKHSYQYFEDVTNSTSYTEIEDFDKNDSDSEKRDIANFSTQQLEYALSKWFEMYSDYTDALDTYFDTISNKYIMPSIQIKNFVSTIDALSENCIIEENKDEKEIEKRKSLEKILEKTREVLKESELNQIRNAIWGKKKNKKPKIPLEPRFNCLLTSISSLLPDEINEEFVKKIVNTRNNITHPKAQKLPAFSAVEYDNASYLLTKVIRAYLLNTLSFNSEIIKKIITF